MMVDSVTTKAHHFFTLLISSDYGCPMLTTLAASIPIVPVFGVAFIRGEESLETKALLVSKKSRGLWAGRDWSRGGDVEQLRRALESLMNPAAFADISTFPESSLLD